MKAKPFAPVLTSADDRTPYPLRDSVHRIVKCRPPINWLRSIVYKSISYPRAESFPRALLLVIRRPRVPLRRRKGSSFWVLGMPKYSSQVSNSYSK